MACREAVHRQDWARAKELCARAAAESGDARLAALAARAHLISGDDDGALARALALEQSTARATAEQIIGIVLGHKGQRDQARQRLEDALAQHRRAGEHEDAARDAHALAGLSLDESHLREAFQYLTLCRDEATAGASARLAGFAWLGLARIATEAGDVPMAEAALARAARALADFPGDLAFVRLQEGIVWLADGAASLAQGALEQALALARTGQRSEVELAAHFNLAQVARELGHHEQLMAELDETRRLAERSGHDPMQQVDLVYHLALNAREQHRLDEASTLLARAAKLPASGYWEWKVQTALGRVAEERGQMATAETAYRAAIAAIERTRAALEIQEMKCWLLPAQRDPYTRLFSLLARSGRTVEALAAFESLQARTLVDAFAPRPWQGRFDSLAGFDRVLTRVPAAPMTPIEHVLAELHDRAIVGFLAADEDVWQVAIHNGAPSVRQIAAPASALAAWVSRLAQHPGDSEAAARLGRLLFPSQSLPARGHVLYVVPSGPVARVAFAALRVEGELLIARNPLALTPSATLLGRLAERPHAAGGAAAVFADASEDLPSARREGATVAARFGAPLVVGRAITRARVQAAANASLLHIATHADVDDEGAWLELGDGKLHATDVATLGLHPRVAVLATCSSAAAEDAEAWGSLACAFLAAGTHTVLATLQSVPDQVASELILDFYNDGGASNPARGLARAQQRMARAAPNGPWPSFVVIGLAD
jgi:tetratricopeptide (TPR) repeat protein